jgi:hypothetical protein
LKELVEVVMKRRCALRRVDVRVQLLGVLFHERRLLEPNINVKISCTDPIVEPNGEYNEDEGKGPKVKLHEMITHE